MVCHPKKWVGYRRSGLIEIVGDYLFEEMALGERGNGVPPTNIGQPPAADLAQKALPLTIGPATIRGKKRNAIARLHQTGGRVRGFG